MKPERKKLIKNILGQETKKKLKKPIGQLYSVKSVFADPTLGVPEVNEGLVNVVKKDRNKILNSFGNNESWLPYLESMLSPEFTIQLKEVESKWWNNEYIIFPNDIIIEDLDVIFQLHQTVYGRVNSIPEEIVITMNIEGNENNETMVGLRNGWVEEVKDWMIKQIEYINQQTDDLNESLVNVVRKKPDRLSDDYVNYEVSHATLRSEDLIETFLDFLKQGDWGRELRNNITKLEDEYNEWKNIEDNSDGLNDIYEDLFEIMNFVSPHGTEFGTHEGDGSSFGFWEYEVDEDDES